MDTASASPLCSVVVPAWNRAEVIGRCLHSILDQRFESFEVILVDDGSTDDTRDVASLVTDPRLRSLHRCDEGVSAARNAGVAQAQGRFVTFLDSDDEALPGWLEALATPFVDPTCGVVCCGVERVLDGTPTLVQLPTIRGKLYENQCCLFLAGSYAIRRDVFTGCGGFAPEMRFGENREYGMGDRSTGRRLLLRAIRSRPRYLKKYERLMLSFMPPLARRHW